MKFEGLNAIALLEGIKGVLALLVAIGVNALAGQDLYQLTEQVLRQWSLSPSHHYLALFLDLVRKLTRQSLTWVTLFAFLYASSRFVMAYGLWNKLRWTEWFAFISGSLYIPFELYAISQSPNLVNFSILAFNLMVITYLYWVLKRGAGS
jgi:uncharacterized membrane protein (DUF2068 family)